MKLKTKKTAAKRFKISKTGKIMRGKQNARHLRKNKSKRQMRRFKADSHVTKNFERAIKRFMPY